MLDLMLGLCYLYVTFLLGLTDIKTSQKPFKQALSQKTMLGLEHRKDSSFCVLMSSSSHPR